MSENREPRSVSDEPPRGPSFLVEDLVRRLPLDGRASGVPATEAMVERVERELGVRFPPDYRTFLLLAGGPATGKGWSGCWRLDELVSLNRELPIFRWFGGLVGIGNEGFIVTALDYRDGEPPCVVRLGLSSSDEEDVTREAETFVEWMETRL